MKRLKEIERHYYTHDVDGSEYDFLEVIRDTENRIKIKFHDERWRTIEETEKVLLGMIEAIKELK